MGWGISPLLYCDGEVCWDGGRGSLMRPPRGNLVRVLEWQGFLIVVAVFGLGIGDFDMRVLACIFTVLWRLRFVALNVLYELTRTDFLLQTSDLLADVRCGVTQTMWTGMKSINSNTVHYLAFHTEKFQNCW